MSEIKPSSGINSSKDHVSSVSNAPTDIAGAPTTTDKYENTRHLNYGQTKNQDTPTRQYSASSDSKPILHHTFFEEFRGGQSVPPGIVFITTGPALVIYTIVVFEDVVIENTLVKLFLVLVSVVSIVEVFVVVIYFGMVLVDVTHVITGMW
ncbi:10976_t:CDS:2 [Diversispora eburnea]|uniref:10976_t:CDS:1 n=1 Tax=Diversispora eburnea TaxID=1213867 RepID=A0A9N9AP85_9GLOM|nr:10976_t:CDS:2 [Diversispora eburnea]